MSTQSQFIQPMTDNEYAQLKDLYANNGVRKIININVSRQLSSLYLVETRFRTKNSVMYYVIERISSSFSQWTFLFQLVVNILGSYIIPEWL